MHRPFLKIESSNVSFLRPPFYIIPIQSKKKRKEKETNSSSQNFLTKNNTSSSIVPNSKALPTIKVNTKHKPMNPLPEINLKTQTLNQYHPKPIKAKEPNFLFHSSQTTLPAKIRELLNQNHPKPMNPLPIIKLKTQTLNHFSSIY
jgi:hypothetical protein